VKAEKVYLVGFMGAGKTTVARALARRLDWQAVDVDELIEAREHQTVADLFATRGEGYFRSVERAVILDQVGSRHTVVATGGGTFVDPLNRAVINRDGVSVWLDVPLDRLVDRVPADGVRAAVPGSAHRLRTGASSDRSRPRRHRGRRRTTRGLAGRLSTRHML
jgi:shikimate kinase